MTYRIPTNALRHIASLHTYHEKLPTFCARLLNIDLYPGSFEDPDGDVIHLSIPCSFGIGHDGLCEFPLPRRAVER